ncbi:hypothetical protein L596_009937 [Steinernema carpocapsae]|nr:hypothetical protein L596_009937 [Steinernema carpocapsae]
MLCCFKFFKFIVVAPCCAGLNFYEFFDDQDYQWHSFLIGFGAIVDFAVGIYVSTYTVKKDVNVTEFDLAGYEADDEATDVHRYLLSRNVPYMTI